MRWQVYKTCVFAAIGVTSLLMAHNAITGATFPIEPIAATSSDLKTPDTIRAVTKFVAISPIESTVPAIGDSNLNAVEVSGISDLSSASTMLTKSNWKYVAEIFESNPDAFEAGTYMAELFENDKSKGAVFFKQAVADPEMIEGVIAVWEIGNNIPTNAVYTVKVTKSPINAQGGETT